MLTMLSRAINVVTLGRPGGLFCARVHRRRWVAAEVVLDCAFLLLRGEAGHCRRMAEWER